MDDVTTPRATVSIAYDRKTIILHWLTAALVVSLWGVAQVIDLFPSGPLRVDARSVHIALGIGLIVTLVVRIAWRAGGGRRLEPAETGLLGAAGTAVHYLLYALLIAELCLGVANVWVRGDSLFNLVTVPAFDPGNRALGAAVGNLHGTVANVILIVAGLHALAALFHHYIRRDGVLRRML
ncbi:MAG TPA: cytochrome b [Stellaceae bacterium]|nr:cytochrome b [Stellaceae bacterium]